MEWEVLFMGEKKKRKGMQGMQSVLFTENNMTHAKSKKKDDRHKKTGQG